ncbi:phosphoglycerate kinase [Candidatus Woesebacteria bacterium]|nr:phosphoglycerate kinase [Candidatus Woesebacteria bacterium]
MSKSDCLAKLTNSFGKITIAALDHRGSLKESLNPNNPDSVTESEMLAWKTRMVELYRNEVSGLLLDPIYGKNFVDPKSNTGWMLSMEKTGYKGGKEARVTEILPEWSVKQAKEMGACSVKLLLYYDSENVELAKQQREVARQIAEDCRREGIVFLLEPLSYKIETDRESEVLKIAEELKDLDVDIFKFEYPGSLEACKKITAMMKVPWVLLSAGMEYAKYKIALQNAMEAGASGFAVGRAVWQEFGQYYGEERERYFKDVALLRMRELVEIVNSRKSSDHSPKITQGSELRDIEHADVKGKKVIVRVDWNVTLGKALQIVDDTRIVRTLPTIKWLLDKGASQVILLSHLGKAEEKRSLVSVVEYASNLLGSEVKLCDTVTRCQSETNRVVMMENLRLWEGEEKNDPEFAKELASMGDIYVNEAFGESHRAAASIVGITKYLPSYAGMWLSEEVETIMKLRENPGHPYVVVMGGAKVDDKIKLIEILSQGADTILLGGKLANEYSQRGMKVSGKAKIMTPIEGSDLLDIGEATQKVYAGEIAKAKTVVWNGPMGKVEDVQYERGTIAIYEAITANTEAYTLVGGGDTLASIGKEEHLNRIDHVSTGGGAMLKLLETGRLVGVEVLFS